MMPTIGREAPGERSDHGWPAPDRRHDVADGAARDETRQPSLTKLYRVLGPGLITGAADDDPSGIATYSQVGAQFGYGLAWSLVFSYPLMAAIHGFATWA
jgi:hypothetical protein